MYPAYRYMNAYPHGPHPYSYQKDYMMPPYYQYLNSEAIPPYMRVESSKPPSAWGPGNYHSNVGHQSPGECSGCCFHSHPYGHLNFRPPYPQPQPFPQSYYGPNVYHEPYPYFVPPPSYSVDQAQYDYDKFRSHCCGCPNHSHRMDNSGVRVEEQSPEGEQQDNNASSLMRLPSNSSPMVWVPSGNCKGKEENKKPEQQSAVWFPNNPSQVMSVPSSNFMGREENKNSEAQPAAWNGWIPMDIGSLKDLMRVTNEKKNPSADENKNKFSWPLIWVPGNYKTEEGKKDVDSTASPQTAEEVLPKLKIIPMKLLDDRGEKPGIEEQKDQGCEKRNEKETKTKIVPVKHIEEISKEPITTEKHKEKDSEQKAKILGSNHDDDGVKNTADSRHNGQSKTSKLPPVCLRVDPLPKKKNGNGKSRSPSPPSHKVEQKSSLSEDKDKIRAKEIQVVDINNKPDHDAQKQKQKIQDVEVGTHVKADNRQESKEMDVKEEPKGEVIRKVEGLEKTEEKRDSNVESKISEKRSRILSPIDAAVLIQSAYRGYGVRRWRPLEKLKKIAEIQKQVDIITKQLQTLEEAPNGPDKKQMVVLNENIMHLLLQLDTIQGLHQSVREARKRVARELICLQEKLDAVSRHASKEPEKTQATISDGTSTSDHPVSGVTSLSTIVLEEDKDKSMDQTPDDLQMEQKIMDSTKEGNAASEGQVEMTIHEVSLLAEEDSTQQGGKDVSEASTVATEVKHLLNENKDSGPLEQKEVSSTLAKPSDSDVSRVEESDPNDSCPEKQGPFIVKKQSDSDVSGTPEPDVVIEEPASDQNELASTPELAAHEVQEATSKNAACILEEDNQEKQDSNFQLGQAKDELSVADAGLDKLLVPTSRDATAQATLPIFIEPEVGTEVANLSEVPSKLAEPLSPLRDPSGDSEVVSSLVEKPECIEVSTEVPNNQFSNAERMHEEHVSLEANRTDVTKEIIKEDGSVTVANASTMLDKPADASIVLEEPAPMQKVVDMVEAPRLEILDTAVDNGAAMTKEEHVDHNDEAVDNAAGMLKEEPVSHSDQMVRSEGLSSANNVEDVVNADSVEQTAVLSNEEMKNTDFIEQTTGLSKKEMTLVEENEKLREMLERLLEAGKTQLGVIADLNGRVKDLEKKLSQKKKKLRSKRQKFARQAACKVAS